MDKPWLKYYPAGIAESLEYPEIPFYGLLQETATEYPIRHAIIFYDGESDTELGVMTYRELDEQSDAFASALVEMGIGRGDRVAYMMANSPDLIVAYYGILKAGAVPVPCNTRYLKDELAFQLNDTDSRLIVVDAKFEALIGQLGNGTTIEQVIVSGGGADNNMGRLLDLHTAPFTPCEVDLDKDLALLPYTGGTTGTPKGAMLTHRNMVVNAVQFGRWYDYQPGEEVFISALPLSHLGGIAGVMSVPVAVGGTMVLMPKFNPKGVLRAIQDYGATRFLGVPTMYISILNCEGAGEFDLSTLTYSRTNAAPLPIAVKEAFDQFVGREVLIEGYGLTETSPLTHANPIGRAKGGSIGVPLPNTEARIVDLQDGVTDVPIGEQGELILRGPQIMAGYLKKPEETANAIRNGWFYTGDIARMDGDGYFYIVDRKKDLINVSGFKVWPREIEEILYLHENVKMVAVTGVFDDYRGESVLAAVVLKKVVETEMEEELKDELRQFCRERMASFKIPHRIEILDALPLNTGGKVLRRKLREIYAS
jgi:long-chain acyl-CoA synthetase